MSGKDRKAPYFHCFWKRYFKVN